MGLAIIAPAIDLQPVAAKLEIMSRRDLVEQVFDVTPQQVLRRSAFDAQQMVVVPLMA